MITKGTVLKIAGGFVFGAYGKEILTSKAAKVVYKYVTCGALIVKDKVMENVELAQTIAGDVAADARELKAEYEASKAPVVYDCGTEAEAAE